MNCKATHDWWSQEPEKKRSTQETERLVPKDITSYQGFRRYTKDLKGPIACIHARHLYYVGLVPHYAAVVTTLDTLHTVTLWTVITNNIHDMRELKPTTPEWYTLYGASTEKLFSTIDGVSYPVSICGDYVRAVAQATEDAKFIHLHRTIPDIPALEELWTP